jgi:dihydrofolate reductase/thymidylate synthase
MVVDEQDIVSIPIRVVVAVQACDNGIGYGGQLPWPRLSDDLAYFQRLTTTNSPSGCKENSHGQAAVIMGRKTWFSLPPKHRPLPGRLNIVLSRQTIDAKERAALFPGAYTAASLDDARMCAVHQGARVAYVIGGAGVFQEAMAHPACDRLYVTRIRRLAPEPRPFPCDTFMPSISMDRYVVLSAGDKRCVQVENAGQTEQIEIEFMVYRRGDTVQESREKPSFASESEQIDLENSGIDPPITTCNTEERQYLDLVRTVIETGHHKADRTGVGTLSLFGAMMRFSLRNHRMPLLTTKRVFWRGVVEELLWFLRGSTDAHELAARGVHIWDENASRSFLDAQGLKHRAVGDLGPIYGFQWRHFGAKYVDFQTDYHNQGVDQIRRIVETLRTNPDDRRMILSAWNPTALSEVALPPCHVLAQFYVADGELSCLMFQRSCDLGLGVPFNIASYALLTMMLAHVTGLRPGEFVHTMGDVHVYRNHVDALRTQLLREPRPFPHLRFRRPVADIDDFLPEDFELVGYRPHQVLKMDMAV